jgi:hypothetical protein
MKKILKAHVNIDLDSMRRHKQEKTENTRRIDEDEELAVNTDTIRENRIREFSLQKKDVQDDLNLMSMRLRKSDSQTYHTALRKNDETKLTFNRNRDQRLQLHATIQQNAKIDHQMNHET